MRIEDDEPPIKSHPASKEYRANYDTIDWGPPDEPRVGAGGNTVEALKNTDSDAIQATLRTYANYVQPVAYGVIEGVERRAIERSTECSTCGAKDEAPCDDEIHATTGQPIER